MSILSTIDFVRYSVFCKITFIRFFTSEDKYVRYFSCLFCLKLKQQHFGVFGILVFVCPSIFSSWCFSWSGFAWLCAASVSNCRCCTAILHAWPWWHCNTWLVIKISLLVLCYILLCCDTDFNPYWTVISASVVVSSANFVLHD